MIKIDDLMSPLDIAMMAAEEAHRNQSYDIFGYMYHIKAVVKVAQIHGFDETIQVACALHDVLEDGSLSYNDIKKYFGEEVTEIVYAVTDELGRNRHDRKELTYPKIRSSWQATAVKLCDRIANMAHSSKYTPRMMSTYRKEYPAFKEALFMDEYGDKLDVLWSELHSIVSGV